MTSKTLGNLSVGTSLVTALLPFLIPIVFPVTSEFLWTKGIWIILGGQLVALIMGAMAWRSASGKVGVILSIAISASLVAYSTITTTEHTEVTKSSGVDPDP